MADDKNGKGDTGNAGDDNNGNGGNKEPMIPKSRFDEVNTEYQRLKKAEETRQATEAEAEKTRLEEQGKFKEVAEKEKQKRIDAENRASRSAKVYALKAEALKKGTVDADAVVAIANLDNIKVSEDGTVDTSSVTAIIDGMVKDKAYLFGKGDGGNANIGDDGGAPNGGNNNKPTYKRSQLGDREFYTKNRDDILKAQSEGRIIDDVSPQSQTSK